ncbi:MAG: cob(I)yrinic acid a,c-diamide adenosyltransferase [Candidatus Sericytochromatia bacterium]|nr:cob(I)yrinic acid a,c-diamide adenosyltransferase [Candidatus Sericytochromatia bacterium]
MRIYTKTGDAGETSLYRGGRIPKNASRLEAYGTLDELNAVLGQALAFAPEEEALDAHVYAVVKRVQRDLFCLGAQLATLGEQPPAWRIEENDVKRLEMAIDAMDAELPPMQTFILPGGHPFGATLHVARTVARRAERLIVGVSRSEDIDPSIGIYINRLSDYLFVAARYANMRLDKPEPPLVI